VSPDPLDEVKKVRRDAERLYTPAEVDTALDRMAAAITARIGDRNPIVLGVMVGGVVPLGLLLPRLPFPLQVDYVHASRYQGATEAGELAWIKVPDLSLRERTVLVVDDVLDRGATLAAIIESCRAAEAREVLSAVLVDKAVAGRPTHWSADFAGLQAPDRWLFGYGMDYKTYLRNGDGIYALRSGA
jgi:hypoxanthine phosphoribosyltransferase